MNCPRRDLPLVARVAASRDRALGLFWLGLRFMDLEGQYDQGLGLAERSYQLAKQLAPHDVLHATFELLYGNASLGRWQRIDALHEEHLENFQKDKDMSCPYVRGGLLISAAVLAHRGDLARAREQGALVPTNCGKPALSAELPGVAPLACGEASAAPLEDDHVLRAERGPD